MEYLFHIAILFSIYAILAMSLNLIVGYTGLFSIAHAAFYGIGAYSTAILLTRFEMNFFLSVIVGLAVTLVISLLIGIVLSRFRGDFYAIVSLGFVSISYAVFMNWKSLTKGPFGLPGVGRPYILFFDFSSNQSFLLLSLSFLLVVYLLCRFIAKSSFGRVLRSIRENEKVVQVYGYNTAYFKLVIFVIGSMMTSIAGSLIGSYLTLVSPTMFTLNESIFILTIAILGGLANLHGSILGALFLILLPEALRFSGLPDDISAHMNQLIYSMIIMLLMLYRPQGLMGEYKL